MAQRAYSLQANDLDTNRSLEEERRDLLARFGALTLDLENVRAMLTQAENRRRSFFDALAQRFGVREYRRAWLDGQNMVLDVYEQPEAAMTLPVETTPQPRAEVNGRG